MNEANSSVLLSPFPPLSFFLVSLFFFHYYFAVLPSLLFPLLLFMCFLPITVFWYCGWLIVIPIRNLHDGREETEEN